MAQQGTPESSGSAAQPGEKAPFLPRTALPKGGGAIRGIGEKVAVNPARGSGTLQVPVFTSPGRSGFGPALGLAYDSGAGNSAYGMGWSLPIASIARKTDKGLPRYTDADTFVFSGGEDLVESDENLPDEIIDGVTYRVTRYRPRVQSVFTRIERLRRADGDTFWRTVTPDNVRSVYGRTARIADPDHPARVFQWLLEEVRDDCGNVATYEYAAETVPAGDQVWERNRRGRPEPQRYLHRIHYCDHFLVELDYQPRPDAFSTGRPGFEVRTRQRCTRIAMYHDFPAEFDDGGPNPRLIRSTDLSYDDDPAGCHLVAVTQTGHLWSQGAFASESVPPVEFEYTRSAADSTVRAVEAQNLPAGVDDHTYHWVDLDGEGLSGALTQQGGAWFYRRNLGAGRLGALQRLPAQPSIAADGGSIALLDLAGDGARALVRNGPAVHGYQERTDGGWGPFRPFASRATIAWNDPALRPADLDGDRHHLLETLTYHYERDPADPRVKHDLVLEVDEYNVARRAVSIGYPRRTPQLPEQEKLAMLRTVTQVVHATSGAAYRLGVPVETSMFEVTGLTPAGPRFTLAEADQPGAARLVEWVRTGYWNDALTAELPFGQIGTRALIHQTYKIAYWAAEVDGLFGGRVTDQLLAEGGYVQADGAWWIPLRGAAPRPGRVLPAHSGGQPVRQRVQRAVRRLPPAAGVLARVRHRTVRRAGDPGGQRLPAAGPGAHYRPQRQQRQGPLRRPRPGHRDLDPGQGRRGRSRTATGCGVRLPHRERADLVARQPAGAARRRRLPVAAGPRLLRRQRPGRDDQVQGGARPGRPTPLGRHRPGRLRQQGHAG